MKRKYILPLIALIVSNMAYADVSSSIGVKEVYDDNIYRLESNENDAWITKIMPAVTLEAGQGTSKYSLLMNAEAGIYSSSEQGDDDYTDYEASGLANWELNQRNRLDASLQHRAGHDARGTGRSDVAFDKLTLVPDLDEPDEWALNRVAAKYTFGGAGSRGNVSAGVAYGEKEYTNNSPSTDILERDDTEVRLLGLLKALPRTSVLLEARWHSIDYEDDVTSGNRDSEDSRYFVGVEWEATAKTTGSIRVGYQEKDPDFFGFDNYYATAWEVQAVWSPKTYSTLEVTAFRGAEDSGDALTFIDYETYMLRWNHNWSSRLTTAVFGQVDALEYQGFSRHDDVDTWGFSASYLVSKLFKVNGQYQYEDRNSSVAGLDYERNVVVFGAEMSFE